MNWNIRQLFIAVLILGAVGFAGGASDARAGTYSVTQCNASTGAGLSPQWASGVSGSWSAQNLCSSGIQVAGYGNSGSLAIWDMSAPPGVNISSVVFGGQGLGSAQVPVFATLCNSGGAQAVCNWTDYANIGSPATYTLNGSGQFFRFQMGSSFTSYTSSAYGSIYNMEFTLSETTAPSLGIPAGNLLVNGWNRGNHAGGIGATDGESGIQSISAVVDSNPAGPASQSSAQSCSATNIIPCPKSVSSWTPTISTGALADGSHTLRYTALDYANNSAQGPVYAFKVDNTNPDVPLNVQIPGSKGWSATNDFDLTWTNGAEDLETATQSGIGAVKIDVDPVGLASDPAPLTIPIGTTVSGVSATHNSLSNLTVPAIGAYKLKLSVVDRAGNESPIGDGSNGAADGIFDIGFDPNPPAAPQAQNNGWISRAELAAGFVQQWSISVFSDGAPICGYAKSITPAPADPGTAINLPGAVNSLVLPSNLTEGDHWVNLRAVNCSMLASVNKESVRAPVDLTDPVGTISGVEDGHWYKDNQSVQLAATDALSGMAPKPPLEPDVTLGAYLSYTLNNAGEQLAPGNSVDFTVSGEGVKELKLAPVDFAGNQAAPSVVRFGIDATAPTGSFSAPDADRPTLISAPVSDQISGIAFANIQIRNIAGGDWITLPTSIADSGGNAIAGFPNDAEISARFPDTKLEKGTFSVRLTGIDRAGNTLTTSKRADGSEMTLTNPLRDDVRLSAGLSKAKRTCGKRKGVKCIKKARGKVVFSNTYPSLAVGFKRGAVVQGFLTTSGLTGLGRQPIEIFAKSRGSAEVLLGTTSTRADGSYVFKIKPGISRQIRVYYPGTEIRQDASVAVQLGTAAKLKIRASRRHARTGQTVVFRGQVRSFDGALPAAGKIVALQFYAGKKWRPAVGIVHTDDKGNFTIRYKFDGAHVKARIVFRAYAPTEDSWGHVASASKRITLRLN